MDTPGQQTYEIFVAGIPATTTVASLTDFFVQFGPVDGIELQKVAKKKLSKKRLPKQYCRLKTSSEEMFKKMILGEIPPFRGRSLFCQEFKRGDSLEAHSSELNARRIVIKKVPRNLNLPELQLALEKVVGIIEVIYEYQSDLKIETSNTKQFKTVSTTFKNQTKELQDMIAHGFFQMSPTITVQIEQFSPNRKKVQKKLSTPKGQNPILLERYQVLRIGSTWNKNVKSKGTKLHQVTTEQKNPVQRPKNPFTQYKKSNDWMSHHWDNHFKPTCTAYHRLHESSVDDRQSAIQSGVFCRNLRFNILLHRVNHNNRNESTI